MTAEIDRLAEAIPIPRNARGVLTRAYVGEDGGSWRVYFPSWASGDYWRPREYVGPSFPLTRAGGRQARGLADRLNKEVHRG